jgi:ABC-type glycerol-3-phosphate transport system substrate-binding protein
MKKIKEWIDEGIVHPGALELASGMDFELYKKGVVAMDISWWALDPKLNPYAESTVYLPPPRFPKGPCGMYGQHCLSIPKNSRHKKAAWEFLKFFNREDIQFKMIKSWALLPNLKIYLKNEEIWKINPNIRAYPLQIDAGLEQLPKIDIGSELGLIIGVESDAYWAGTKTLDEAINAMTTNMADRLRKAGYLK